MRCPERPNVFLADRRVDDELMPERLSAGLISLLFLAACQPAPVADARAIPVPQLEGPIANTATSHTWNGAAWQKVPIDLSAFDYVEEEYLVTGTAHVYDWVPGSDFDLVVLDPDTKSWLPYANRQSIESTAYTTRIVVRRPASAEHFSGRVVVEIINMTAGYDWTAIWGALWEQVLEQGDAYVGITSKPNVFPGMQRFDAARYGRLAMPNPLPPEDQACGALPGDAGFDPNLSKTSENGLAWDIFTQVGAFLKSDEATNPLGRAADRLYFTGESQSGNYLTRYFRWFHQRALLDDGRPVYDGYLAEAGGTSSAVMRGLNQCATVTNPLPVDDPQREIPDRGVPLMVVHSEWDFPLSRWAPNYFPPSPRRPNANTANDKFMMWELAGASHGWAWQYDYSDAAPEDVTAAGFETYEFKCGHDQPEINLYMAEKAAYVLLDRWVTAGTAPPPADYIQTNAPDDPQEPRRDAHGNAIGGLRMPEIAVPIARYTGVYVPSPDCMSAVEPFDRDTLRELYPEPGDYLRRFEAAANALVEGGFLLPGDAAKLIRAAAERDLQ